MLQLDSIVTHAARNDAVQANGLPLYVGSYIFAAEATLTAIQELILRCCRSFQRVSAGRRIELIGDDPRPAVFFFGANHLVPGSLGISKRNVSKSANVFVPKYRDLQIPAIAAVTTAVAGTSQSAQPYSGGGNTITTLTLNSTNPFGALCLVSYGGGADPTLNGQYFTGNEDLDSNAHFVPMDVNVVRLQGHATGVAAAAQTHRRLRRHPGLALLATRSHDRSAPRPSASRRPAGPRARFAAAPRPHRIRLWQLHLRPDQPADEVRARSQPRSRYRSGLARSLRGHRHRLPRSRRRFGFVSGAASIVGVHLCRKSSRAPIFSLHRGHGRSTFGRPL